MTSLDPDRLERFDSLFVAPHGDDVPLSCPARVRAEADRGRRVLVLALFEPADSDGRAAEAVARLGAVYRGAGLAPAAERRPEAASRPGAMERGLEDEEAVLEAAHLLAEVGPRTQAVHIHAPLGLGASIDHGLAYEATVRAFASGAGRNLFLYEERPEAFVPGAVRTRLALLGARLPPAGAGTAPRVGLLRMLWRVNEPRWLRGEGAGLRSRLAALAVARRRWRAARAWSPSRALGPRLQPIVCAADEEASVLGRSLSESLLPADRKGRPRRARRFNARAAKTARALGAAYHAERLWLFLPSGEGLAEVRHPLESEGD
jgi:LmbE family N-acetylglucosaminyl deacetylase